MSVCVGVASASPLCPPPLCAHCQAPPFPLHTHLHACTPQTLLLLPPTPPHQAPLRVHALEWAGRTVGDKLSQVRKELAGAGAGALLVTTLGALRCLRCIAQTSSIRVCLIVCVRVEREEGGCVSGGRVREGGLRPDAARARPPHPPTPPHTPCPDEVAWLLNLRGGDVPYNPGVCMYVRACACVHERWGAGAACSLARPCRPLHQPPCLPTRPPTHPPTQPPCARSVHLLRRGHNRGRHPLCRSCQGV